MSKFYLEIDLGNETMRSKEDISLALSQASKMALHHIGNEPMCIRDRNGNVVGFYEVR